MNAPSCREAAELVRLCAAGDDEAAAELCERLLPAVRTFARRRHRAPQEVDDFVQDALLVVLDAVRAGVVERPEAVGAFALGVCRNLLRERGRREARRAALIQRHAAALEPLGHDRDPTWRADVARMEDCLSRLTDRARRVILGTWYEDRTAQELGAALSMKPATVRVARHRAIAALRDCLDAPFPYGDTL